MAKINGVTVPIKGYEPGDYYTEEPTNGAYQCMGFAFLIYDKIWGSYTYGTKLDAMSTSTEAKAKKAIQSLEVGALIHCDQESGVNHSMIVIDYDDDGVTVYDANWDGYPKEKNKIGVRTWTYSTFASKFTQIRTGYNPD